MIGGSGNGEQIAANKIPGIRAALAFTRQTARLPRQHNDANDPARRRRHHREMRTRPQGVPDPPCNPDPPR
jgi:ribose 5-phosphate isomerase B